MIIVWKDETEDQVEARLFGWQVALLPVTASPTSQLDFHVQCFLVPPSKKKRRKKRRREGGSRNNKRRNDKKKRSSVESLKGGDSERDGAHLPLAFTLRHLT